jgi:hypothetical protein
MRRRVDAADLVNLSCKQRVMIPFSCCSSLSICIPSPVEMGGGQFRSDDAIIGRFGKPYLWLGPHATNDDDMPISVSVGILTGAGVPVVLHPFPKAIATVNHCNRTVSIALVTNIRKRGSDYQFSCREGL